ncbi:M23 family metallopeptidase [Solicola sp. PLA-1-18]|uniref:M23 family metallopeptidase n=1 Tax=Solicola sp. PLA-1-18 TaxID=3380532 RepID=UPI003B7F2B2A
MTTRRSTRRRPGLPTPAAAAAVALIVVGVGAIAVSSTAEPQPLASGYQALADDGSDLDPAAATSNAEGTFDVSRDFDRDLLERQAQQQAQQRDVALGQSGDDAIGDLVEKTQASAAKLKTNQWVLPVAGYRLTARFGQSSSLWATVHTGLDFAAPSGTTIVSVARGTVKEVSYAGAYGNRTVVTLEDGTEIWYCHQSATRVKPGDPVDPGQPIGNVGSTGNVTGPHLHLEVRPGGGSPVDPQVALAEHGVRA